MHATDSPTSAPATGANDAARDAAAEILAREPLFHRPEIARDRAGFAGQMTRGFWEVTETGHVYHADAVLDLIDARTTTPDDWNWHVTDARCEQIGTRTYLFTYTLTFNRRRTRRTTIWVHDGDGWRARYHQGTPIDRE